MLNRTFKSLMVVMILAGAPGAPSAVTPPATHAAAAPHANESAAHERQRLAEEGCRELPAPAPIAPPAPATCS